MPTRAESEMARLAARLAIPERAPDPIFVARVELEIEARGMAERAARERREQLAVDISAAAALLLAAKEMGAIAEPAAELLLPLTQGMGGLALLCALVCLLLVGMTTAGEERA